jgi:hypothetical protein
MIIHVELDGAELENETRFATLVQRLSEALIPTAQEQVRRLPPLYKAGVRYREEPAGYESMVLPLVVFKRRFGDCWHLCVWRVAELRNAGEKAGIRVKWKLLPRTPSELVKYFHVQVRRGNGNIEDPSALLGMPSGGFV